MIYKVVAIYDVAIESYGQPVFVNAIGAAVRSFGDEIKRVDQNNAMNKHPQDYQLFLIGSYDDQSGELFSVKPERIASGSDYV